MVKMTKKNVTVATVLASLPVLFFFQNCSQTGSTASINGAALGATSTSDSLVIVPPNSNSNSNDISIRPPSGTDDDISSEKGSIGRCDQLVISDILLNITSVNAQGNDPNAVSFEIVDSDKSVSLEKLSLRIKAQKTDRVRDLVLILNAQGNKILTADSVVIDMQTQLNQQTVVRVTLLNEYTVTEGQIYSLTLQVNPNELIAATNKNNCLFKPLIQAADLASLR